jgi:hypothetical protein
MIEINFGDFREQLEVNGGEQRFQCRRNLFGFVGWFEERNSPVMPAGNTPHEAFFLQAIDDVGDRAFISAERDSQFSGRENARSFDTAQQNAGINHRQPVLREIPIDRRLDSHTCLEYRGQQGVAFPVRFAQSRLYGIYDRTGPGGIARTRIPDPIAAPLPDRMVHLPSAHSVGPYQLRFGRKLPRGRPSPVLA